MSKTSTGAFRLLLERFIGGALERHERGHVGDQPSTGTQGLGKRAANNRAISWPVPPMKMASGAGKLLKTVSATPWTAFKFVTLNVWAFASTK